MAWWVVSDSLQIHGRETAVPDYVGERHQLRNYAPRKARTRRTCSAGLSWPSSTIGNLPLNPNLVDSAGPSENWTPHLGTQFASTGFWLQRQWIQIKKHKAPISVNFQWKIVASKGKWKERTEKKTQKQWSHSPKATWEINKTERVQSTLQLPGFEDPSNTTEVHCLAQQGTWVQVLFLRASHSPQCFSSHDTDQRLHEMLQESSVVRGG